MFSRACRVGIAAALLLPALPGATQPAEPVALGAVVVTATRSEVELDEAPAATTVVTREQMDLHNVYRLGDALGTVPGLYLKGSALGEAFPASGVNSITLRGIPRTPRTLVLLDGQPLNNALSGGVNFAGIALDNIERVEVVRGPFSALYGGHAMGGVIQLLTAAPTRREAFAQLGAGDGELPRRGLAVAYKDRADNGVGFALTAGYRASDGWDGSDLVIKTPVAGTGAIPVTGAQRTSTPDARTAYLVGDKGARPWEQYNASLTLYHDPAPGTSLTGGVAWSKYRVGASPPRSLLRNAAGNEVFRGDLGFLDGGNVRLALAEPDFLTQTPSGEEELRAFARAEVALGSKASLRASVGWLDHGFRFPLPGAGAGYDSGPGEFFDQPNQRLDVDVHARVELAPTLFVTAGGSYNRNTLDRAMWRVDYWRDFGTRTAVTSAAQGTTRNTAAYAEAQWLASPRLSVYAGGRYDRFETWGSVSQTGASAFERDYPPRSAGQFSPKLAVVAELSRQATLRFSYGEGFRAPTLLDLYSRTVTPGVGGPPVVTEPAPDLDAERVRSIELGVDATLPTRTRAAVSLFAQRLTDLIYRQRVGASLNLVTNAGEAKVEGVEVEIVQPLFDGRANVLAAATHLFRYDVTRNDAVPASVGKRLTDVPQSLYAVGIEGKARGWSGSLTWRYASHVFGSGDDQNRNVVQNVPGSYDRYGTASLKVGYELSPGLVASVAVDNLGNAHYFQFYRQPGRSVWLELAWRRK